MGSLRLSDHAMAIMDLAAERTAMLNHKSVEPEQLLHAVITGEAGVAVLVLAELKVNLSELAQRLDEALSGASIAGSRVGPSLSERAVKMVACAEDEARHLGSDYLGTEHLLLGVLREEGLAAKLLVDCGCTYSTARRGIKDVLGIDALARIIHACR